MGLFVNLIIVAGVVAIGVYGCPEFKLDNKKVDNLMQVVIAYFKPK